MEIVYIALAAFTGGIIVSLLGWLNEHEPFDIHKFAASLLRALLAAGGFAAAYTYAGNIGVMDIVIAVLGGAGIDAGGKRLINVVKG